MDSCTSALVLIILLLFICRYFFITDHYYALLSPYFVRAQVRELVQECWRHYCYSFMHCCDITLCGLRLVADSTSYVCGVLHCVGLSVLII